MATSRWRSSLANVETRLRRGLGISGPIDLELPQPAQLVPVVIADDLTRPGTASSLRGRYWRTSRAFSIAAARGCYGLLCVGSSQSLPPWRPNIFDNGVNVDEIEVFTNGVPVANSTVSIGIFYFPTVLVIAPGLPIAIATNDVFYIDPMRVDAEPAPLQSGTNGAVDPATGGGRLIFEGKIDVHARAGGSVKMSPAGIFLNDNSALIIGTTLNVPAAQVITVNIAGRVF